jgi:hypothetical protein
MDGWMDGWALSRITLDESLSLFNPITRLQSRIHSASRITGSVNVWQEALDTDGLRLANTTRNQCNKMSDGLSFKLN